jgi:hypothetical protein
VSCLPYGNEHLIIIIIRRRISCIAGLALNCMLYIFLDRGERKRKTAATAAKKVVIKL